MRVKLVKSIRWIEKVVNLYLEVPFLPEVPILSEDDDDSGIDDDLVIEE